MTSDSWETLTLSEVAHYQNGRATKPAEARETGMLVVKIRELNSGVTDKSVRVDPDLVEPKHRIRDGDLLFAWSASVGIYVWRGGDAALNQHIFKVQAKPGTDQRFLRYLLEFELRALLSAAAERQTTMGHVRKADLARLTCRRPPIEEQRAIAEVLGALDDRIEWCYRVAGTLLELSRAAFFEWVARSPDAETGIYDLATVEYGAPYKSALFNDEREGLPVIRIRDVGGEDTAAYTTERHPRDVIIEPGDIVVGMDGEFRAHPWRGPVALLNQRVCSFRPKTGVARSLVLHALEQPLQFYENSITGTTVIHLGKKHIDRFKVPYSEQGNELLRRAADPMLDHIVHLSEEKRGLQRLRDTLLPELLSGGLRIEDPSRLVGAVA